MTVVSFSMAYRSFWGGSGRLDTHLDTPPSINRCHLDSCLAQAEIVCGLGGKPIQLDLSTPPSTPGIRSRDGNSGLLPAVSKRSASVVGYAKWAISDSSTAFWSGSVIWCLP